MICKRTFSKTPTVGSVSWNTDVLTGILYGLIVSPTTATSLWDLTITDDQDVIVYSKKAMKGIWRDTTQMALYGIYTMALANAANEVIKVQIIYNEIPS